MDSEQGAACRKGTHIKQAPFRKKRSQPAGTEGCPNHESAGQYLCRHTEYNGSQWGESGRNQKGPEKSPRRNPPFLHPPF